MKIRTTKPEAGNKYFIRKSSGGYSTCIQGKPTDKDCNVLSNCVGYACGAYNEELALGYEKYHLNCNAENFIERAIASGLSVYKEPIAGGIMVWQKGATLSGKDGAGHVAICTQEIVKGSTPAEDYIITSDSAYGGKPFYRIKRRRGNGNWGASSNYKFRGCIAPKGYIPKPVPPTPKPEPKPEPKPTPITYSVGDEVIVNGVLTADSYGGGAHTKNYKNKKAKIIIIKNDGRPRPYALNMNNNMNGVTGWGSKDQIRK